MANWLDMSRNLTPGERAEFGEDAAGLKMKRLAPMTCGWRGCPECGERAREHAKKRLYAAFDSSVFPGMEWTLFVTLTFPRRAHWDRENKVWLNKGIDSEDSDWTPEMALRNCRSFITAWMKTLRQRRQRREGYGAVAEDARLQYAWVIELHPSAMAWPHVHCALSLPWPPEFEDQESLAGEIRLAWQASLGVQYARVDVQRARGGVGTADYLLKYLTKQGQWSEDHLAILYRRRMWSSSLPVEDEKPPSGWEIDLILSSKAASAKIIERSRSVTYIKQWTDAGGMVWLEMDRFDADKESMERHAKMELGRLEVISRRIGNVLISRDGVIMRLADPWPIRLAI